MAELQTNLSNINFMSKERFDSLETIDDGQLYAVEFPFTDGDLVHTTGDEEINGVKTFNDDITAPNQVDYTRITNCITEIPQDIKLELKDGVLTLKAGSKVYVPNGVEPTDEVAGTEQKPLYAWEYTITASDTPAYIYTKSETPVVGDLTYMGPTNMTNTQPVMAVDSANNTITFGSQFYNYVGTRSSANDTTYTETVYKTNPKFDVVEIENDISGMGWTALQGQVYVNPNRTSLVFTGNDQISSGETATISGGNIWYDTANNILNRCQDSTTWTPGFSLPICVATSDGANTTGQTNFSSIDQVFNGFGYIGSTVFALPGVKGLVPNGRNENGTFNNIEITIPQVVSYTYPSSASREKQPIFILNSISGHDYFFDTQSDGYIVSDTKPTTILTYQTWYNGLSNYMYWWGSDTTNVRLSYKAYAGYLAIENGNITTFNPREAFKIVDLDGSNTFTGTVTFTEPIQGTAYRALWGDLAEYYESDKEYPRGTLVQFGGSKEITIASDNVNAVITSEPGFILNTQQSFNAETSQAIALVGKVPVRAIGKVKKFDYLTLSDIPGVATVWSAKELPNACVIARALENKNTEGEGLVFCTVKFEL